MPTRITRPTWPTCCGAADDKARHRAWAADALTILGLGGGIPLGMANAAFARVHGMAAETIGAIGRPGLELLARVTRAR